jgi:hypothetical protein
METIIILTYTPIELQVFWNSIHHYENEGKQIFIDVVDYIAQNGKENLQKHFEKFSFKNDNNLLVLMHSSSERLFDSVQDLLTELFKEVSSSPIVRGYSRMNTELTDMTTEYSLINSNSQKPLDRLRNSIVHNNKMLFNEGFEEVWTFFFQRKTQDDKLNAKLNLLHNCLVKNDDVKKTDGYDLIKDIVVIKKENREIKVDEFLDKKDFFDPDLHFGHLVSLRDALLKNA